VRRFSMTESVRKIGHRGPRGLRVPCAADLGLFTVRAPPSSPLVLTRSVVAAHRSALSACCAPSPCTPRGKHWQRAVRLWLIMLHPPVLPHFPTPAIRPECGVGAPVLCGSLSPPVAPPPAHVTFRRPLPARGACRYGAPPPSDLAAAGWLVAASGNTKYHGFLPPLSW